MIAARQAVQARSSNRAPQARLAARARADLFAGAERLRVSEATGADIEHLGLERGHRTLTITRRAARSSLSRWRPAPPGRSTWPPANAATVPSSSPLTGGAWTGTAPGGSSARSHAAPGSPKSVGPHTLRHAFITTSLDAGVPLRDVQEAASHADPRTTMRYARAGPRQPGPARHLYRRRLRRRRRPVTQHRLAAAPPGGHSRQAERPVAARRKRQRGGHGPQPQREREPPYWAGGRPGTSG
jgi:integrase